MKVYINCKCDYKKADSTMKKSIFDNMVRLNEKLSTLHITDINQVFNNDGITYDRINSQLYLYKGHGCNGIQLRIVYAAIHNDSGIEFYVVDYISKTKNNKDYIKIFHEKYHNCNLSTLQFVDVMEYTR